MWLEVTPVTSGQAASVLKEISDKNRKLQRDLSAVLKEADLFIQRLDVDVTSEIEKNIPGFRFELNNVCQQLESGDCPILVAGETSAGKSSLLNLLLGEDVLPQSLLSTTHVICELKRGTRKRVVVHSLDGDDDIQFDLVGSEENQKREISKYIYSKEKVPKYKKVEIFWPSPILHEGIFLVDSPGVGDDSKLDSITSNYLSQACAFIYVINTANAGGVQPDRVLRIIQQSLSQIPESGFHPKSAIFVFNKWDQVPKWEEEEVKVQMIKRLQKSWPELDPTSQVFYMSVQKAAECQRSGVGPTEDFTKLLEGIRCLLPEGLVSKLKISYGFLDYLLRRTYYYIRARLVAAAEDVDKKTPRIQSLRQLLDNSRKRLTDSLQTLEAGTERCFESIVQQLYDYLKSDALENELASWDTTNIAEVSSIDDLESTVVENVDNRISNVVSEWIAASDAVQRAYEEMNTLKTDILRSFEDDIRKVEESILTTVDDATPAAQPADDRPLADTLTEESPLFRPQTAVLGLLTAPVWAVLTVAAAVISLPVIGLIAAQTSIEKRRIMNRFNADPGVYMSEYAREYLKKLTKDSVREFLSEELEKLEMRMERLKVNELETTMEANKKLLEDLSGEVRSNSAVIREFQPVANECQALIRD
ncbi:bacterial dynamin-like protein [Branchiostoma lanceolatum]|uniref:bacterial dynamin-like protein n=1 Tax=Branchiostoma lanceolatum TaxID=7740 RepID=UPI00345464F5